MGRWAVIFDNAMGNQPLRDRHKDAHHAYLVDHRDMIRLAGATRAGDEAEFSGGMWIVENADRETALRLAQNAPFFLCGLHTGCRVFWWGSAPGFEAVTIAG